RLNRPQGATPGEADTKFEVRNEAEAQEIVRKLEGASYRVIGVEQKRRTKSSNPPYITSTLQQDASSRLRMRPFAAMRVAQQLYEGVELGAEGPTGLITYMRTDSTRIAGDADSKVKGWIKQQHGEKYVGVSRAAKATPGAQDAHEAIRPTDVNRTPDSIREHLSADQYKLYDLIWRRFVASRMAPAVYDQTQVEIQGGSPAGGGHVFRANGSVLAFDGFYKVWGRDENGENELPFLAQGEDLDYHGLKPEQHFTQPPPRYTEATLIKELEQRGIGRPSTYAPIVQTITKAHGYVQIKDRRLEPTRPDAGRRAAAAQAAGRALPDLRPAAAAPNRPLRRVRRLLGVSGVQVHQARRLAGGVEADRREVSAMRRGAASRAYRPLRPVR